MGIGKQVKNLKGNEMGLFNSYEYDPVEEETKRRELLQVLENSPENKSQQQKQIAKISKCSCSGSFYSAYCPNCGKLKILSSELLSMQAICNKCYCVFSLEE